MQRSAIIFIQIDTLADKEVRKLVMSLTEFSQVWIAHDSEIDNAEISSATEGLSISGLFPIRFDEPIELQSRTSGLPSDPVFLLIDLECSRAALSYNFPLVWFHPRSKDKNLTEPLNVINTVNRSSFVIGPPELARKFNVGTSKFSLIEEATPEGLFKICSEAKPYRPNQELHGLLVSEMFRRDHLFGEGYRKISMDVSGYIRNQIYGRLFLDESLAIESRAHAIEEDVVGKAIRMLINRNTTAENTPLPQEVPDVIANMLGIKKGISSGSFLSSGNFSAEWLKRLNEFSSSFRAPFIRQIVRSEEFLNIDDSEMFPMLCDPSVIDHLSTGDCIKVMQKRNLPLEFFQELRNSDLALKRLVADYGYARNNLDTGIPIHVRKFEEQIEDIDQQSLIPDLWLTGLRYWREVSEGEWASRKVEVSVPKIHKISDSYRPEQIADLNQEAQRLLSIGSYNEAIEKFTLVRAAAAANRQFSTEAAARLNIGWSMAKSEMQKDLGKLFISSVLTELAPPEPLAELRILLSSLVEDSYKRDLALLPKPTIRERFMIFLSSAKSGAMTLIKTEIRKRPALAAIALKVVRKFRHITRFLKLLKVSKVGVSK